MQHPKIALRSRRRQVSGSTARKTTIPTKSRPGGFRPTLVRAAALSGTVTVPARPKNRRPLKTRRPTLAGALNRAFENSISIT
jgi:hypothetical protein